MKDPEKILDIFRTLSDEAAREVADLRAKRDRVLKTQVEKLRSIEQAFNDARRDRASTGAASGYAKRTLFESRLLSREVQRIAGEELHARDRLLDRFADQKRFEVYLSQRQIKEKALARKREEKRLLEQIDQMAQARARRLEED